MELQVEVVEMWGGAEGAEGGVVMWETGEKGPLPAVLEPHTLQ